MAIITTWPSSILNRPLPVHSVIILSMECWPLCDCQHFIINGDGIPLLDEDFTDGTGLGCADLGFHFHGFEDNQHIALFHGVTRRNVHLPDIAAQRRNHRLTVASNRSSGRRCRRRTTLAFDLADFATFVHGHHILLAIHFHGVGLRTRGFLGRCDVVSTRYRLERIRVATVFQELQANLREQGVGQNVVHFLLGQLDTLFLGDVFQLGGQLAHFRLDLVSRAASDRFFAIQNPLLQLLVERRRCGTVLTLKDGSGFLGDRLVALASQYVQYRLGAHNLGRRRYQRDKAQVFTDLGNLGQYLVELVAGILLFQLAFHVGQHAARYLGNQDAGIHALQATFELGVLLTHFAEVSRDFFQQDEVQTGIAVGTFQNRHNCLGGRMAVGHTHGGDGRIHVINAGFRRLDRRGGGHTGGGMALHVDGDIQLFLQTADQVISHVGLQQAGHVFDGDGIGAHVGNFFGQFNPVLDGVYRAGGVGNGALSVLAGLANRLDSSRQVARVVHRIKNTEHVYAVLGGTVYKPLYHVIRIVTVAQKVLATQQHLLGRVGHGFFQLADTIPGVFAQVTDTGIKGSTTPGFERPETDLIEFLGNRQHIVQPHTGGQQGLVGVTQNYVRNPQRFFRVSHRVSLLLKGSILYLGHFLWRARYCAIAFLMASAVSGSTDAGAFGLARGVLAGVAGSGGANRRMILDIRPVAYTRTIRNTNTKPMPAIISSTACDISSFISNSYLYWFM